MKWFKHESDAHANIKLQSIVDQFGLPAYGYYWACLELVANQGEDYRLKREKRWEIHLKKMLNIEIDEQKKYLSCFARHNLIDKESLKKGDLYIPKLAERCDEYTEKVRRKSRHNPDNVGVEENRTDKNRKEDKPTAHVSYLSSIPEDDMKEFYGRFDCSVSGIKSKAEDLKLWCETNGKIKKNYKAFLLNALKKDFPLRKQKVIQSATPKEPEEKGRPMPKEIRDSIHKIIGKMTVEKTNEN